MQKIALIAAGGVLGTLGRYGFYALTPRFLFGIPMGTLGVNVLGSFAAGVLLQLVAQRPEISENLRLFGLVGFLGAFTTFSAFSSETLLLLQARAAGPALLNVTANVLAALGACAAGVWLVRSL